MAQHQRYAIPMSGALMDEMDVDAIKLGAEMTEGVQLALLRAPIEPVGPIGKQLFQILEIRPLVPGGAWCLIGPARFTDALSEAGQNLFLDVDREWCDLER